MARAGRDEVGLGGRESSSPANLSQQIQGHGVRGQTHSCVSYTQSQALTAAPKQAQALSAASLDSSLLPPLTLQCKENRVIYLSWVGHHLFSDLTT